MEDLKSSNNLLNQPCEHECKLLENAIMLALQAHAGQRDSDGTPYVLHPLRVMLSLPKKASLQQRMAAVLHDTLEQTHLTREDLLAAGIPLEVIEAVEILTRPSAQSRLAAMRRAAANPIARVVKYADTLDNMDTSRLPIMTEEDAARMLEYQEVLAWLEQQPHLD